MRTVTVTGHAATTIAPDSAVVRVSAVHRAVAVADALAGADSAARQVVAVGREHTSPERIGSTSLQIWPTHDEHGTPSGYEATHSLTLGCPDIEAAGALLTALAETVGDRLRVEGVSLEVADRSTAEHAAREAAYADAVARGTHLAGLAGAELGDPQDIAEGGVVGWEPRRGAKLTAAAASFEPGEQSVGASVTVSFQLR